MPRLSRTELIKRSTRWSGSTQPDRRRETPKEAAARQLAAARRAARGSM